MCHAVSIDRKSLAATNLCYNENTARDTRAIHPSFGVAPPCTKVRYKPKQHVADRGHKSLAPATRRRKRETVITSMEPIDRRDQAARVPTLLSNKGDNRNKTLHEVARSRPKHSGAMTKKTEEKKRPAMHRGAAQCEVQREDGNAAETRGSAPKAPTLHHQHGARPPHGCATICRPVL